MGLPSPQYRLAIVAERMLTFVAYSAELAGPRPKEIALTGSGPERSSRVLDYLDFVRREVVEAINVLVNCVLPGGGVGVGVDAQAGGNRESVERLSPEHADNVSKAKRLPEPLLVSSP